MSHKYGSCESSFMNFFPVEAPPIIIKGEAAIDKGVSDLQFLSNYRGWLDPTISACDFIMAMMYGSGPGI
jgi:hypothetical protein